MIQLKLAEDWQCYALTYNMGAHSRVQFRSWVRLNTMLMHLEGQRKKPLPPIGETQMQLLAPILKPGPAPTTATIQRMNKWKIDLSSHHSSSLFQINVNTILRNKSKEEVG